MSLLLFLLTCEGTGEQMQAEEKDRQDRGGQSRREGLYSKDLAGNSAVGSSPTDL